ncbi:unnamed protein product [Durusdinium trenchii]|uniref:Uncharacterized protein n=1 Tax=Durusdinium trenchii TaxID=1381693 RepID=A0ABP0SWP5_9DINO
MAAAVGISAVSAIAAIRGTISCVHPRRSAGGCGTVTPGEAMRRGPADGEDSRVIDAMVGVRSGAVKRLGETCKSLERPEGDDRGTGGLATGFWGGSDRCGRMKQKVWQMVSQRNLDVEAIQPELQQVAQLHPYMRQLIQGFLDHLAQQRGCAQIEGVVFSV